MKTRTLAVLILVIAGLVAGVAPAQAAVLRVCPSGCDFSSIQVAVDAANNGDIIRIGEGIYTETVLIDKDLTLAGAGAGVTIIDGDGPVVEVRSGANARITGMTITGGYSSEAGGILNAGTLLLDKSIVTGNITISICGGINNQGTMTLRMSQVTDNYIDASFGSAGGVCNFGTMEIHQSLLSGNSATAAGGILNSGQLEIKNSSLTGNSAARGGGIFNDGQLEIKNSTIVANRAFDFFPYVEAQGGGIFNDDEGVTTLKNTTVTRNTSDFEGGGIYNQGELELKNSDVTENTATSNGGGILNAGGSLELLRSQVRNNTPNDCVGC